MNIASACITDLRSFCAVVKALAAINGSTEVTLPMRDWVLLRDGPVNWLRTPNCPIEIKRSSLGWEIWYGKIRIRILDVDGEYRW